MRYTYLTALISALLSTHIHSAAYVFPELGMMSVSTAGAGAQAIAEGAETAFANPASMTNIEQSTIAFNLEGVISDINYTDTGSTGAFAGGEHYSEAGTTMPAGSFYWVTPANDTVSFGLAIAAAGGSALDYGSNFSGAQLVTDTSLMTVQINPSLAFKIDEQLSVGVGLISEFGKIEQNMTSRNNERKLTGSGESVEFGYTLSAFYELNEAHRFGAFYRSEISHDMDGDFKGDNLLKPASFNIVMPNIISISGYHALSTKTAALWSASWSDFSKIKETTITLPNTSAAINRQWEDTYSLSLGMHYNLESQWRLETGVTYESSPQDDPTLQAPDVPTGEVWKFGVGTSKDITTDLRMQLYYEYYYGGSSDIIYSLDGPANSQLKGEYDAAIHYLGVLFNYKT
ncbi:outer membrane protein transport protein [Vibrio wakamikoensis]|uniref:OmpP1/FadL family transporter n=1 Tax=Vibrio TaxID=662 RepID=UPI003AB45C77